MTVQYQIFQMWSKWLIIQEEIDYAGQIMQRMALIGEKRREAIVAYDQGKYPDADLSEMLSLLWRSGWAEPFCCERSDRLTAA